MGHREEFWQNVVHWRRKWKITPVFLPGEPHEQYENSKRYDMEDEPPRSEGVHYATREVKWKSLSCVQLFAIHGLYSPWNYLGQNTGVDSLSLLQGIFLTQGSNPSLLHCRWILYQLSHKEAQEYWVGSLCFLLQIFPTQELNQGLLHCRWILYQLSYQRSPKLFSLSEFPFLWWKNR